MLPQAVASGKTVKDEHSPEVALCKKIVEGREAGRRPRGWAKAERPGEGREAGRRPRGRAKAERPGRG